QMGGKRTAHMGDRMRQRCLTEEEIGLILELGEWNPRADRLVLSAQTCAREENALRKEIAALERQSKRSIQ
ncbi:MAG: hypothetical protein ACREEY_06230, partial [Brevundimonas sp.]